MGLLEFLGLASRTDEFAAPDASNNNQVLREHNLLDKDPQRQAAAREAYQKNYARLYSQMDEKWREQLNLMASNATGQSIIANMPPNVKVRMVSESDLGEGGASYSADTNVISLAPIKRNGKTGADDLDPYMCLVHEARHAMQDYLGYSINGGQRSAKESAANGMLIEADAFSVGNVEAAIKDSFGVTNPTKDQIRAFMKRDFVAEVMQQNFSDGGESKGGGGASSTEERAAVRRSLENNKSYRFQQCLKRTGGNMARARQMMRSQEFKKYWSEGELGTSYERQTLDNMIVEMEKGQSFGKENRRLTKDIYARIARSHGVSAEEFERSLALSPSFRRCVAYMEKYPNMPPKELAKAFDRIYANAGDQGSVQTRGGFRGSERDV